MEKKNMRNTGLEFKLHICICNCWSRFS